MTLPRVAVRAATVAMTVAVAVAAVRAARRGRAAWKASGRPRQRRLNESVQSSASRQQVYWLCRDVRRLAQLVDPRVRVTEVDDVRSNWQIGSVACTVEITGDVPELLLSWQVADGPVPHHGRLTLHPAGTANPAGGGTRIAVQVRYEWPPRTQDAGIDTGAPDRLLRRALDAIAAQAAAPDRQPARSSGYRG
ncbi:MAG: hypothetical protein J2P15_06150 [Micromonosporaceae bacterium]|nr:hypothetical protein [Micromonosporaceae bacterium]